MGWTVIGNVRGPQGDSVITYTTEGAGKTPRPQITNQSLRIGPTSYPADIPYPNSGYLILDRVGTGDDGSVVFRTGGATTGEIGHTGDGKNLNFKTVSGAWGGETFKDSFKIVHPSGYVHVAERLGVGTEPSEMVHVGRSAPSARVLIKFENSNPSTGSRSTAFQLSGGNTGQVNWTMGIDGGLNGSNNFYLRDEVAGTERLLIDASGNWGLRNNSPACALDVAGAMRVRAVNLTDGTNIATDASQSNHFRVTIAGNRTLAAPSNPTDGQRALWEVTASGGARTLSLATGTGGFAFGSELTALSATVSGKTDYLGAVFNAAAARWHVLAYSKGF